MIWEGLEKMGRRSTMTLEEKVAKRRAYAKERYEKNKDKVKEYAHKNKSMLDVARRARYVAKREQILAERKRYQEENAEKIAAKKRERYLAHAEQIKAMRREYRRANPEAVFASELKRSHGLRIEVYQRMLDSQSGVCGICREPPNMGRGKKKLHVDHDHATGKIRALLCHACNTGLGLFRDDRVLLRAAIAYLTVHSEDQADDAIGAGAVVYL